MSSALVLCDDKEFNTDMVIAPIQSLDIDKSDKRYMLSASADCTISLYDTSFDEEELQQLGEDRHGGGSRSRKRRRRLNKNPMTRILSDHEHTHKFSITCIQWYTHDTGMFMTSSIDKYLKVWDTNELSVACQYYMASKIHMFDQSPIATNHATIAIASENPLVRLIDMNSGSTAQSLIGHKSDVLCVKWSNSNEYMLATGSMDNTIRIWDIRKPGWLHSFDLFHTKRSSSSLSTSYTLNINQQQQTPLRGASSPPTAANRKQRVNVMNSKFKTDKLRSDTRVSPSHNGSITHLEFSKDGLYLLSSGTDNQLRKWDIHNGENTLVTFPNIVNTSSETHVNFTFDQTGLVVYHPNGNDIGVYNVDDGSQIGTLTGHFSPIHSLVYHPARQELYSAGVEHQIFIWTPQFDRDQNELQKELESEISSRRSPATTRGKRLASKAAEDEDEWSSDEEVQGVGF